MRKFRFEYILAAVLVISIVAVASAEKYDENTLIGTWEFDLIKMMKEQMGGQIPQGMDVEQMLAGSFIRITFKKDGTYTFESKTPTAEESNDGKWEVVEKKDNKVVIKSTDGDGEEQLVSLTFKDKDNLDALMPGEPPVTMSASRVKAKAKKEAEEEKD